MVKAKKYLGQHFLRDEDIAFKIVQALVETSSESSVLEIGPGTGVLTKYLVDHYNENLYLIDIDDESIAYLHLRYPSWKDRIILADFINSPLNYVERSKFNIIGNFPYNISSQIFFKILEVYDQVDVVVGMLQLEVAKRLASPPGNKDYGILSVLLQAYYDIEYLFDVEPYVFDPPPKVRSGVIRLIRNHNELSCDATLFKKVVKQGFQNRRKTLRNALKPLNLPAEIIKLELLNKRAEALSYKDFEFLTNKIERWSK